MNDHPDLQDLGAVKWHQVHPARDRLYTTLATALGWATFTAVMAAVPCIIALWRWAL